MKTSILFFIISGIIIGLSNGSSVLPDGPLIASVGGTLMFTTNLNPTETPFSLVQWQVDPGSGLKLIVISLTTGDTTGPEYEGRITLLRSTGSLELRNLKLSDSGEYLVSIQDGENHKSGRTTLDIYEPVSNVRLTPLSADLIEFSSSVSLSCSSSGSSLSFIWMNSSSEVTASDRVQITINEESSTLTIVNVTRNDQGSYRCRVSNPVSFIISDTINISVIYGPDNVTIEVYPSKLHHVKGSDINLTCSADSSPSAEYQWFLNGDQLISSGPLLRLMNIQMNQSGNYSCQAFNSKTLRYQTSQPSPISVHERVSNVEVTQDVTHLIEFSGSVSFSCSSSGSSLSFLWMNSSSEVSASDRVQITDGGSKLKIINVTRYDDGSYSCHVSNPVSNANSDPLHLSVSYGPEKVNLEPPSQAYPGGSNIHLSCSADSRPNATFDWFLNGKHLFGSGSKLELLNVQKNQSGNYSCRAFNSRTSRYQTSQVSAISIEDASKPAGLAGGAIAGIVITCLLVAAAGAAGGYFIYKRRENVKPAPHSGTTDQQHDYENMPRIKKKKNKEESHVSENSAATQRSKEPEHVYEEMAQIKKK